MKTAMILAAGRGERLKPLTEKLPKAMCLVGDKPLIAHHVTHLAQSGFEQIVINHAYLGGQIRRYLGNGAHWSVDIHYAPEPPGGLETGGGILNALPLLGDKPFVTVNADVLTDYNFSTLHLPEETLAHLILVENPPHKKQGDFGLFGNKVSLDFPFYTFSGIACYHPLAFQACKIGRYSVTPLLRDLVKQKGVSGALHSGLWIDIGSFEGLLSANRVFNAKGT
ncbi:MAG: nucleotidyltransferase family protein [Tatlockia sp.]|jgi:MurNAc alpha-1-phosphate uridylyltransferase